MCVHTCVTREHSFPFSNSTRHYMYTLYSSYIILYQHPTTLHKNTAGLLRPKPFVIPYCYRIGNMILIHLVEKSSKPVSARVKSYNQKSSHAGKSK